MAVSTSIFASEYHGPSFYVADLNHLILLVFLYEVYAGRASRKNPQSFSQRLGYLKLQSSAVETNVAEGSEVAAEADKEHLRIYLSYGVGICLSFLGTMDMRDGIIFQRGSLLPQLYFSATPAMAVTLLEISRIFAKTIPGMIDVDVLQLLWKVN